MMETFKAVFFKTLKEMKIAVLIFIALMIFAVILFGMILLVAYMDHAIGIIPTVAIMVPVGTFLLIFTVNLVDEMFS